MIMDIGEVAKRLSALGNETRLAIYRLLVRAGDDGLAVSAMQDRLSVPASTLSHHLHRLIAVGLVWQERKGQMLVCRANYPEMIATFSYFTDQCCADNSYCTGNKITMETDRETV
jgi:DNA-binding transcriptional ArsR family regulator